VLTFASGDLNVTKDICYSFRNLPHIYSKCPEWNPAKSLSGCSNGNERFIAKMHEIYERCIIVETDTDFNHTDSAVIYKSTQDSMCQGWASECADVKNYKWQLNLVWHRLLYSCTHMATVGVKGLRRIAWCPICQHQAQPTHYHLSWKSVNFQHNFSTFSEQIHYNCHHP